MIDLVKILLRAGDGGHGRVSFRREKYIPKGGPSGGTGGNGGDVLVKASTHVSTLSHLAGVNKLKAQDGVRGNKKQMSGAKGESLEITVPVGTIVWQLDSNEVAKRRLLPSQNGTMFLRAPLRRRDVSFTKYYLENETQRIPEPSKDHISSQELITQSLHNINLDDLPKVQLATLTQHDQELLVAQGGFGGKGNELFKSASQTTPFFAEYGTQAEERLVIFELQLLADVGLVGVPNAGKSTFLARTTKANPRVDSYPFTTLEPQLGVWSLLAKTETTKNELVVADIPGLIQGASQGQGLGYEFLRHIKACGVLLFILTLSDQMFGEIQLGNVELSKVISQLEEQLDLLKKELNSFDKSLLDKKQVVAVNKIDLLPQNLVQNLAKRLSQSKKNWFLISGNSGQGLPELQKKLITYLP
jgi:GTPase